MVASLKVYGALRCTGAGGNRVFAQGVEAIETRLHDIRMEGRAHGEAHVSVEHQKQGLAYINAVTIWKVARVASVPVSLG